jgi:hypothetical protein
LPYELKTDRPKKTRREMRNKMRKRRVAENVSIFLTMVYKRGGNGDLWSKIVVQFRDSTSETWERAMVLKERRGN